MMKKKTIVAPPVLSILIVLFLGSCKIENSALFADHFVNQQEDQIAEKNNENIDHKRSFEEIEKDLLQLVETESFSPKEDNYTIDFRYPFLDTIHHNKAFKAFNDFITTEYLDVDNSLKSTLNERRLSYETGY